MNGQHPTDALPLGLLELDPAGIVIRYAPTPRASLRRESVVGRDFFTEVMPAEQLYGFRARFLAFMDGGRLQERFALRVPRDAGRCGCRSCWPLTASRGGAGESGWRW